MNAVKPESLGLQRLYHWERTAPGRIALSQPMGGGVMQDFTWSQVADQVRRMAAHLKAQGCEPGSKVAILSKNCAWWLMSRHRCQPGPAAGDADAECSGCSSSNRPGIAGRAGALAAR